MTNRIFIGDVVFYFSIGFLAGALAAGLGWRLIGVCITSAIATTIFILASRKIALRIRIIIAILVLAAIVAGFFYYFLIANLRAPTASNNLPIGQSISFSVIISDPPKASTEYLLLPAQAEKPLSGELMIFAPLSSKYQYGDELAVQGKIESPQKAGDTPAIFPKSMKLIAENRGSPLRADVINFKTAVLKKFEQFLPGDDAALVAGELFGGNDGMSAALKAEMSASGTSYVLSMYGYKMSLVILLIEGALAAWVGRRARFTLTVAAIISIVALSGGNVSAVRAAVMALAALAAKLSGRVFDPRNTLVLVATGMTLFDPTLPASAAFELSVLSIVGIFYLVEPLQNFFGWTASSATHATGEHGFSATIAAIFNWREAIIIATATLLPIIPVIAVSFGDFSLTAFPSNALISFAILPTMMLGIALAVFGSIAPPLAIVAAKIGQVILFYQFMVIKIFAAVVIPLPIPVEMPIVFIGYYVALIWFARAHAERF